ncbi:phage tail protein I [Lysinibacillus pakistanensis]|uniref:Phage tail protein I n=1 Tax=Lysinibacillus pakistanensis TaxID=759811 RepID=A0AAX3X553_9BACI|nr:phage tail protein I [Lysinibacillus pakistanensis]MDM5233389.1 phage tail protein I [Lysinibacillus pakistanensis]WHY48863.1 phage tail protein I [Lysinibacillus pakistanensis]WHY53875.1 phage tail protein I [Lysinibacillus pakistanensis]
MIDLKKNTLIREIPDNLLVDEKVKNLATALQASLDKMLEWTDKINYTMNLENLDDAVLDHLLWEKHITWAEGLALATTRQQKINLIRSAIDLHRTKGTPYAIEKVLEAVGLKGEVLEWWQYDVDPYHFSVELQSRGKFTPLKDVRGLILHYKNTRSWFDGFVLLAINNEILFLNDSYQYPVFYETCGEFGPEALFWGTIEQLLNLNNDSYQYPVEYDVFEAHHTQLIDDEIRPQNDSYQYKVVYPTIGEMEPLEMTSHVNTCGLRILPNDYHYPYMYPICGEFYCEE